jgi:hypothetical protein
MHSDLAEAAAGMTALFACFVARTGHADSREKVTHEEQ